MSPLSHLFIGWLVAETAPSLSRRERALVTFSGVIPDIDGAGVIVELLTRDTSHPLLWFSEYHHTLHGLLFSVLVALAVASFSKKRLTVFALSELAFHIHLLCDLAGARGPDGVQWPIPYLFPFGAVAMLSWKHQWYLNAWPNFLITGIAMFTTAWLARARGYSIVSIFSEKADAAFVAALRNRFPFKVSPAR